jgi:hypothetical protein
MASCVTSAAVATGGTSFTRNRLFPDTMLSATRRRFAVLVLATLALAPLYCARAQKKAQAQPKMQVQPPTPLMTRLDGSVNVYRDAVGQVAGCALRVVGVEPLPAPRDVLRATDLSLLIGVDSFLEGGTVLVGASSYEATPTALRTNQPTTPLPVSDGWLQAAGGERTLALGGQQPNPSQPNTYTYRTAALPALDVINAALNEREVEAGLRRQGEPQPELLRARLTLPAGERQALLECMNALAGRARARRRRLRQVRHCA